MIYEDSGIKTKLTVCQFAFLKKFFTYNLCCSFSLLDSSSLKNLRGSNSNTVFAIFAVIRGILEPGATVKILSLGLGFGVFSVVMVIAVAVHLLYYGEQKSKVRAVLQRHRKPANIDYRLVWKLVSAHLDLGTVHAHVLVATWANMLISISKEHDYSAVW